jgi:RNA polymerase sigma factor (sigma-70 family)
MSGKEKKDKKEKTEKESDLHSLLETLPEEERIILTLFYVKSHSAEEIASLLSVPIRAVESVLLMGRQRLLSALGIEGK